MSSDDRAGSPLLIPQAEAARRALAGESPDPFPRLGAVHFGPITGPAGQKGVGIEFRIAVTPFSGQVLQLSLPLHMPAGELAALLRGTADAITKMIEGSHQAAPAPANDPADQQPGSAAPSDPQRHA